MFSVLHATTDELYRNGLNPQRITMCNIFCRNVGVNHADAFPKVA